LIARAKPENRERCAPPMMAATCSHREFVGRPHHLIYRQPVSHVARETTGHRDRPQQVRQGHRRSDENRAAEARQAL